MLLDLYFSAIFRAVLCLPEDLSLCQKIFLLQTNKEETVPTSNK